MKARLQSAKPKRRRREELDNEELEDDACICSRARFYFARCPVIAPHCRTPCRRSRSDARPGATCAERLAVDIQPRPARVAPTEVKARLQSAKPKRRREEELDNEELEDDVRVFCAPVFTSRVAP